MPGPAGVKQSIVRSRKDWPVRKGRGDAEMSEPAIRRRPNRGILCPAITTQLPLPKVANATRSGDRSSGRLHCVWAETIVHPAEGGGCIVGPVKSRRGLVCGRRIWRTDWSDSPQGGGANRPSQGRWGGAICSSQVRGRPATDRGLCGPSAADTPANKGLPRVGWPKRSGGGPSLPGLACRLHRGGRRNTALSRPRCVISGWAGSVRSGSRASRSGPTLWPESHGGVFDGC